MHALINAALPSQFSEGKLLADFAFIHGLGLLQLGLWLSLVEGSSVTWTSLLWAGTLPFVVGDVIKAVAVATLGRGLALKWGKTLD